MSSSFEAAIALNTQGKSADEVTELVLDNCKTSRVTGLDKFTHLKVLMLNNCGISTLEGFPTLPLLQRLEIADNNLSDGLEALQDAALIQLRVLVLAGNKFASLDSLEPLASLPSLRELDTDSCAVTQVDEYRTKVFELLPNLKYLDQTDADGEERDDDEEDGEDDDDDDDLEGEDGEDGDSLLEDSEQEGLGEEDDDDIGDSELGEDEAEGEDNDFGEEGDESEVGEGEDGEEGGEDGEDDEAASESGDAAAKRQKR